jgi:GDPmannose 4,6-dehydratase
LRRALVIGAAGQDGSYLCELLVEKGYEVTGVVRRPPAEGVPNLADVRDDVRLVQADLVEPGQVETVLRELAPDEVYNVAGPSFGPDAWSDPVGLAHVDAVAVCRLLESVRANVPSARFFQASSALVFGRPPTSPQSELSPYAPVELYGAAKAYADFLVRAYRDRHGVFACSGILYNHESPRRDARFASRKITRTAAAIKLGLEQELLLGDLDAVRDWGFAGDYVEAAWRMLQADGADDYVVATGEPHTVQELVEVAFGMLGLEWRKHVRVDPALQRGSAQPTDLIGDSTRARERLGWVPSVGFEELVELMVRADVDELARG